MFWHCFGVGFIMMMNVNFVATEELKPYMGCFEGSACNNKEYCCLMNYSPEKKCHDPGKEYCAICPALPCPQHSMPKVRGMNPIHKGIYVCVSNLIHIFIFTCI